MANTSSSFHAATGKKKKSGGSQKLPAGLASRMKNARHDNQPVPEIALSAYGRRRKQKMRG